MHFDTLYFASDYGGMGGLDIYSAHVQVTFLQKIRDEHRFESFEALKAQIERDVEQATAFFAS